MESIFLGLALSGLLAAPARLTIHADRPTVKVSRTLYGLFFEEINCAGDGGLYAELVRNRGFEDSDKPDHWVALEEASVTVDPSPGGNRCVNVKGRIGSGIANRGYWGMHFQKGKRYVLNVRTVAGYEGATLMATLRGAQGDAIGRATLPADKPGTHSVEIVPTRDDPAGRLDLTLASGAQFCIDDVSLFPKDTWKGRANGLRSDLAVMLDRLNPAFVRFPGGCWVEGDTMATAYRWKQTIGDLSGRSTVANLWGYKSTNGLGYHEYLQMCEDLDAEPLFVINCGMSHREVVPMDKMGEFVQDALDAIEYANGSVATKWGALRAAHGHPKPFGLKYLEIGNENGGPAYNERYKLFVDAIKSKYPEITLIANVWGGVPNSAPVEMIDEHYYSTPEFFLQNANRYDTYDRKGPKVYVGEYAVTQGCGNGNLRGALGEAAFMMGMERNADVVVMASYAPLFANLNAKAWNPDLIYFDSSRAFGTPSYWVQEMFARHRPDEVVGASLSGFEAPKGTFPGGGIGIGTWGTQAEFKDLKVVRDGVSLFESVDGKGLNVESGAWNTEAGAFRQTSGVDGARAWFGDGSWTRYTFTCRARRLSGAEGFLITVGRQGERDFLWWNLGGWGNRQHAIELAEGGGKRLVGRQIQGSVETGRWYDIRVDYAPDRIVCTLDGKVMYDESFPVTNPIHWVAGRTSSRDVTLKLVNSGATAVAIEIDLPGIQVVDEVLVETLTDPDPWAENTLEKPNRVKPERSKHQVRGGVVRHRFPPHSLTVMRWKRAR